MLFMNALDIPTYYDLALEVGAEKLMKVRVKGVHHATQYQLELSPRIMKMRRGKRK